MTVVNRAFSSKMGFHRALKTNLILGFQSVEACNNFALHGMHFPSIVCAHDGNDSLTDAGGEFSMPGGSSHRPSAGGSVNACSRGLLLYYMYM